MTPVPPVAELVEFTASPGITADQLEGLLANLDVELGRAGGFVGRVLLRHANSTSAWMIKYDWETLEDAQSSMSRVASSIAFQEVMSIVDDPTMMRLSYFTRVGE